MFKLVPTFSSTVAHNTSEIIGAGNGTDTSAITDAAAELAKVMIAVAVAKIEAKQIMAPAQGADQVAGKV